MSATPTGPDSVYKLLLFVAGAEPNSSLARANLARLGQEIDGARLEYRIIDVFLDAESAIEHGVLVTPCLLLLEPPPRVLIAGNLADLSRVRALLRLAAVSDG